MLGAVQKKRPTETETVACMPGMTSGSSGNYDLAEDQITGDDIEQLVRAPVAPRKPVHSRPDAKRPSGYGRPVPKATAAAQAAAIPGSEPPSVPRARRGLQEAKMQDSNVHLDSEMTRLNSQVDAYR